MAITTYIPCKENDYFVCFRDWGKSPFTVMTPLWTNPLAEKMHPFQPYIPRVSELAEIFQKNLSFENKPVFCWDFYIPHLIALELGDLLSVSQANKDCFVAVHCDKVWREKMRGLLSNVACLPRTKCAFNPEQQFQIVFKAIQKRKAPFLLQHNYWMEQRSKKISAIEETNGVSQEEKINVISGVDWSFFGLSYDGTPGSIATYSTVGQCLYALKMIPQEFNDQAIFDTLILGAQQAAANTVSIQDGIEEVAEGNMVGPEDDYHLSLIIEMFAPESNPTEDQIQQALCSFKAIEYTEFKIKAFSYILINPSLKSDAAKAFCLALPESLRKQWLDKILEKNHNSTIYEGQDHGNGFFDHMIHVATNSKIAQEAAFEVFVSLENKNRGEM